MSMGIELRTRPAEQVYRDHKATHAGICTTCCSMGKMWTESVLGWTVSSWKWRSPACSQKTTYLTNDWSGTCLCTAIVRQTPSTFCECLEYPGRVRCLVAYIIKILENAASKQDRIAPSMCQRIHCWMGEPASWVPTLHQPPNCWLQTKHFPHWFQLYILPTVGFNKTKSPIGFLGNKNSLPPGAGGASIFLSIRTAYRCKRSTSLGRVPGPVAYQTTQISYSYWRSRYWMVLVCVFLPDVDVFLVFLHVMGRFQSHVPVSNLCICTHHIISHAFIHRQYMKIRVQKTSLEVKPSLQGQTIAISGMIMFLQPSNLWNRGHTFNAQNQKSLVSTDFGVTHLTYTTDRACGRYKHWKCWRYDNSLVLEHYTAALFALDCITV